MDLLCQRCGEPWDRYGVTHGDMSTNEAARFLAGQGCPCCPEEKRAPTDALLRARALHEVLGDDLDAIAAEESDWC